MIALKKKQHQSGYLENGYLGMTYMFTFGVGRPLSLTGMINFFCTTPQNCFFSQTTLGGSEIEYYDKHNVKKATNIPCNISQKLTF